MRIGRKYHIYARVYTYTEKKYEKKTILKYKSDLFEFQKGQIRDIICVYANQVNVSVNYFSFQLDFLTTSAGITS